MEQAIGHEFSRKGLKDARLIFWFVLSSLSRRRDNYPFPRVWTICSGMSAEKNIASGPACVYVRRERRLCGADRRDSTSGGGRPT